MASWPARAWYPGRPGARGPSGPSSSAADTAAKGRARQDASLAVLVRGCRGGGRDRSVRVQELYADDLAVRLVLRPDDSHLPGLRLHSELHLVQGPQIGRAHV